MEQNQPHLEKRLLQPYQAAIIDRELEIDDLITGIMNNRRQHKQMLKTLQMLQAQRPALIEDDDAAECK